MFLTFDTLPFTQLLVKKIKNSEFNIEICFWFTGKKQTDLDQD